MARAEADRRAGLALQEAVQKAVQEVVQEKDSRAREELATVEAHAKEAHLRAAEALAAVKAHAEAVLAVEV